MSQKYAIYMDATGEIQDLNKVFFSHYI